MKLTLKPLEWGVLANELALTSSVSLIIGGILGIYELFQRRHIAIFSLITGVGIFIVEYPRGYREDLPTVQRRFQSYIAPLTAATGLWGRNYYARFILYLCLGTPCCFLLPTLVGGVCIIIAAIVYLKAALCGYEWKPLPTETGSLKKSFMHSTSDVTHINYASVSLLKETIC